MEPSFKYDGFVRELSYAIRFVLDAIEDQALPNPNLSPLEHRRREHNALTAALAHVRNALNLETRREALRIAIVTEEERTVREFAPDAVPDGIKAPPGVADVMRLERSAREMAEEQAERDRRLRAHGADVVRREG